MVVNQAENRWEKKESENDLSDEVTINGDMIEEMKVAVIKLSKVATLMLEILVEVFYSVTQCLSESFNSKLKYLFNIWSIIHVIIKSKQLTSCVLTST